MYDDVLVPVAGIDETSAAVEHAIHVARQNGATVHPVYVVEVSDVGTVGSDRDELGDRGREAIEPIAAAARESDLEVEAHVLEGTPHERIVEHADAIGVDLVVMATTGKDGLSRVLLGSTAEEVVRNSPVPVLTVREPAA